MPAFDLFCAPSREEPVALRSFPNPCRGRTQLAFALTAEAPVTVAVHDARGRLVRTLLEDRLHSPPDDDMLDALIRRLQAY